MRTERGLHQKRHMGTCSLLSCGSRHYRKGLAGRWEQHACSTSLQDMQLAPGFSSKDTGTKKEHKNHGPSGVVGVSAPGWSVPCLTCIMTSEKVKTAAAQPTVVPRHSSPPTASMAACHSCPHALRGCFCSCHTASNSCRCQVACPYHWIPTHKADCPSPSLP